MKRKEAQDQKQGIYCSFFIPFGRIGLMNVFNIILYYNRSQLRFAFFYSDFGDLKREGGCVYTPTTLYSTHPIK